MARWAYMLFAFAALATWAGAQGPAAPAPLSAEDKLRLLKANNLLITQLVDDGVRMANASDSVDRADRCRSAARSLVNAIEQAAADGEAERVAELTGLFRHVVSDGLKPTIEEANREVTPESPKGKQLREVRKNASDDLSAVRAALDKLGENQRVKEAARQLNDVELK